MSSHPPTTNLNTHTHANLPLPLPHTILDINTQIKKKLFTNGHFQNYQKWSRLTILMLNICVCECLLPNNNHKTKHKDNNTSKKHSHVRGPLRECCSIRSGASGLPYYCAPLVCISVVIELLAVWCHNKPKNKNKKAWGSMGNYQNRRTSIFWSMALSAKIHAACSNVPGGFGTNAAACDRDGDVSNTKISWYQESFLLLFFTIRIHLDHANNQKSKYGWYKGSKLEGLQCVVCWCCVEVISQSLSTTNEKNWSRLLSVLESGALFHNSRDYILVRSGWHACWASCSACSALQRRGWSTLREDDNMRR